MSPRRRWYVTGLLAGLSLFTITRFAHSAAAPAYTITDLGPGIVTALAKDGLFVGGNTDGPDGGGGILVPTRTPLLPTPPFLGGRIAGAHDRRVVGYGGFARPGGLVDGHAFVYSAETGAIDLGTLGDPSLFSAATGIANDISAFGDNATRTAIVPLVFVDGTTPLELPTLGGKDGYADAVNPSGVNVGNSQTPRGDTHATLWAPDGTVIDMHYPNFPGWSWGWDVNSVNWAVGVIAWPGAQWGFLWVPHLGMLFLGALPEDTHGGAYSVNDAVDIVGESFRPNLTCSCPDIHHVATLWQGGVPIDLNTRLVNGTGWHLIQARGINEAGQIVGIGTLNGAQRSWLLTPQVPASPWRRRLPRTNAEMAAHR
jgi:hypothetical protein